ncbi:MAG TPA: endopeptidase IV, partial [Legionella sp.]|nr:endopeptidase IV [Legionella sp.]
MKSPMPWFYLFAAANAGLAFANDGVDAYRQGDYLQAAQQMTAITGKDPMVDYYMGRMRLYGYGQLKNDTLAMRHFQQAADQGFLPAIRIMAGYALFSLKNPEQALYWFKKAADKNDTRAQMYCAAAYMFGVGVKQNPDMAKRYYILAAKNGDSIAQCTLAQSFLETHQSANKKLGLIWLNKAVAQNNPEAQVTMGALYASGTLVPQDFAKARELVGLAVAQGYVPALYQMGEIARLANELPQAKEWYIKAANAHDEQAEMALSTLYMQEKSPMYDLKAAFLWMLKAAQNGSHDAQLALSDMYKKGWGVEADEHIASEWQQTAAKTAQWTPAKAQIKAARWLTNGKATALAQTPYRLHGIFSPWENASALKENHYNQPPQMDPLVRANLYQPQFEMITPNRIPISDYYNALVAALGEAPVEPLVFPRYPAVSVDETTSVDKLEKEAHLGDASAQYRLAQMYQQGIGVKQNIEEAIRYYQLAAAQQNLRAAYQLSVMYLDGHDVPPDYKKGMDLLQDVAFKGNAYAQYVLGQIYAQGLTAVAGQPIVQTDEARSRAMYALAAVNDNGLAQYRLAEMMVRESPADGLPQAMLKRMQTIKALYQGAVTNGVEKAALPLAFFNAMDTDKLKQEQAFEVAKKAANTGNLDAALLLGLMYDHGIFVTASQADAVHWYQQAETNPMGAFLLGTHLSQGTGVDKNLEKGYALLQQSAQAGFSYAHFNLAIMQYQRNEAFLPELDKAYALGNSTAGLLLADYYLSLANNDEQMKQA